MTVNDQAATTGNQFAKTMWTVAALTVPMLTLIISPFWWPHSDGSVVLYALYGFNGLTLLTFPLIYLAALTLYARRLRSLLGRVSEKDRAFPAGAVWLVIAVPFNFAASFFVVVGIARSLVVDGRIIPASVRRWRWLGTAWCSFQVLAFVPQTPISLVAALLSYALWAAHWVYSVTLDEQLAPAKEAASRE
ncbi:Uncharacterised protein [Mycobacteroides abscessus subsp. bolletii]|uniref:hypothetical protein n=1 Tax=Mycobacteroides abscessus TaxID=36809 RepID=UPI00092CC0F8|nr:hypothetical protein [Mycobacteroides abscessus]SHY88789.1 Uncharacterised protein [Mycobacteroides abscessus subsp. bolletii]SHZ08965.1 Uncharacterised protein [Mycobacteroides abscessus subsp. bolletii]